MYLSLLDVSRRMYLSTNCLQHKTLADSGLKIKKKYIKWCRMPKWLHVSNVINDFWKISQQIPLELGCSVWKKNLKNTRWVKAVHKLQFFFLHFNSLCMAPIVFSWPLSSNVPRNFWWHMDTSMYLPSDRRRILSLRSLQHKIYYSTSVLDGVYPSIGRLFAFQLAYLYTTPAISSDYYFFLLLSWTMYSAIYTPCVSY